MRVRMAVTFRAQLVAKLRHLFEQRQNVRLDMLAAELIEQVPDRDDDALRIAPVRIPTSSSVVTLSPSGTSCTSPLILTFIELSPKRGVLGAGAHREANFVFPESALA